MTSVRLSIQEILILKSLARQWVNECDSSMRMPGMDREMELDERVAVAYCNAALMTLCRRGAISQEWLRDNRVELEVPDFEPLPDK
jgi:hypothetical protein